jgi:hypothetical protein
MESASRCLDHRRIRLFLGGQCLEEQAEDIATHVAQCPACSAAVAEASRQSDTIVRMVRETDCRLELEPAFQGARRRLLGIPAPPLAMPALPLTIGQYELIEPIGKGGMGRVFKAVHQHLKRTMAVKVLAPERARDSDAVAGFLREMEAIGRLDCPYVVRATDAACVDGVYFLVMEYVPGLDLARLLDRIPRLGVADACEIIRQAALGLQYAHENGLVHCDIKPSNLMLAEDGTIQILDLGLARFRAEDSSARVAAVAGTVDYMAPEQWSPDGNVDIRSDIYGLGCTLFKLLAGLAPFEESGLTRRRAHQTVAAASLVELRPDVPEAIGATVKRMLAKRPQDRFAEPREVAAVLAPFCEGNRLTALIQRAAGSAADTVRVRNAAETVVGGTPVKGLANRKRLVVSFLALSILVSIGGLLTLRSRSNADDGWKSVSLVERHSYASHDKSAAVVSRQESGRVELDVRGSEPVYIRMGLTTNLPFQLRASVRSDFVGGPGIYFGFKDGDGRAPRTYQSVTVRRDEANADQAVVLWTAHTASDAQAIPSEFIISKWFVSFSDKQHFQTMEVSAAKEGVGIRWNGVTVVADAVAEADAPPAARQFQGKYGLLVGPGQATIDDFQVRIVGSN